MSFESAASDAILVVFDQFGVDAEFAPYVGEEVDCRVVVNKTTEMDPGGNVRTGVDQIVLSYLRAEIDRRLVRGETFTVGSVVYTVKGMAQYPGSYNAFMGKAVVVEN